MRIEVRDENTKIRLYIPLILLCNCLTARIVSVVIKKYGGERVNGLLDMRMLRGLFAALHACRRTHPGLELVRVESETQRVLIRL